ncbi:serine hydrolase [Chryseomicrobium sp. FSL W7-1435]|uniref:serine hydrolase domain-containing protein n=1 Tax=Chryseomicrobium sp. FSL W7-1435 TaxID=2921704 RepID=UPI003159BD12
MTNTIQNSITSNEFSGTLLVTSEEIIVLQESYGYANRSEKIQNHTETRFGIASGCKIFTAVSILQLVEAGKLSVESKLMDLLDHTFPHFAQDITIHHLLTHTSGVPDYFNEDVMDDFEELWIQNPMYHMRKLEDFIPLFENEKMLSTPGEKFHYNNTGYILLGLVVEKLADMSFADYVQKHVFQLAGMENSGYFELDQLPSSTALGYIDFPDGKWKSNIYSVPVKGGADGGAFVTAGDMDSFWSALMANELLSKAWTDRLLTPHAWEDEETAYGYGVWIDSDSIGEKKYHVMDYDPGVSFHSGYYPCQELTITVCSNKSQGAYPVLEILEEAFL